jgi:glycosyltransferase involved in cell wall biosynthesis
MKIFFVSFQGLDKHGSALGMVRIMEHIADALRIDLTYFVSYTPKNYKYFNRISFIHQIFAKLIWSIGVRLKLHIGLMRLIQEVSFDFHVARKIKYPCLLVTSALIPTAAKRNSKAGGINIYIAANPYDAYIKNILDEEEVLFNSKITSAYNFLPRLIFIDKFLKNQNLIISQSKITYDSFRNFNYVIHKNFDLLPDRSVFPDLPILKRNKLTFIYIGSSIWLKGLTYLVKAWNILNPIDAQLVIAGPIYGDVWNSIKVNLIDSIKIIGFVSSDNLNQLYRESHVCIVPSLLDDHPANITEAMYCGLPVIATDGCGSSDLIVNGKNGFVIPIRDSNSLADKINWFIENENTISEMGNYSRKIIDSINQKFQAEDISNVIKNKLFNS